jgi:hypothetical protein
MNLLGLIQLIVFLMVSTFSCHTNKDIFSPTKWYLLTLFIFFGSIFFSPYPLEIHITYFALLMLGFLFAILEKGNKYNLTIDKSFNLNSQGYAEKKGWGGEVIWILTIPSIIAQFYIIYSFDGLAGYINSVDLRVVEWSGFGFWLMLISSSKVLSLIYFCMGLISRKPILSAWWVGFFIHLSLVIAFALLSGGRGKFLGTFVAMLMAYHYLIRPVKLRTALVVGTFIIVIAMIMGIARNSLTLDKDGFRTGYHHQTERLLDTEMFEYGLWPLEILYKNPPSDYQMGLTYLAGFTNLVPKQLWKDKPMSGGVFLTNFQRGDDYIGTSHITPGVIGEGIINFGMYAGIIIGFLILIIFFLLAQSIYRRFLHARLAGRNALLLFGFYYYLHSLPANLVKGEMANMLTTKIIAIFFLISIIYLLRCKYTIK